MPMTVPMQAGGSKSLPAELKVGGGDPFSRFRAEHPGYGNRTRSGFSAVPFPLQAGPVNPLNLNPIVRRAQAMGMSGLGEGDTGIIDTTQIPVDTTPSVTIDPLPTIDPFPTSTPLPAGTDIMAGLNSIVPQIPDWSGPTVVAPTTTPPTPPAGYSWAQVLNAAGQNIGQILAITQGGSVTRLPNGLTVMQGSTPGAVTQAGAGGVVGAAGAFASPLGISTGTMLMVGGIVLVMVLMNRGR